MGKNFPKGQHYIPKMLLKNFCNPEGRLWVGDKKTGKIYCSSPQSVFINNHFYTKFQISETSGEFKPSPEYEEALGEIEKKAAPVLTKIITELRKFGQIELSAEDRTNVNRFLFAMARRTPESQARLNISSDFRSTFYEAAKRVADDQNYDLPAEEKLLKLPDYEILVDCSQHNFRAEFAAGSHCRMKEYEERFCRETFLSFVVIKVPKRSFMIGSHGTTIVKNSSNIKQSFLPIAHDICIYPKVRDDKGVFEVDDSNKDRFVQVLNSNTLARSRWVACRSELLIRSKYKKLINCPG